MSRWFPIRGVLVKAMDIQTLAAACTALGLRVPEQIKLKLEELACLKRSAQTLSALSKYARNVYILNVRLGHRIMRTNCPLPFGRFIHVGVANDWRNIIHEGYTLTDALGDLRKELIYIEMLKERAWGLEIAELLELEAERLEHVKTTIFQHLWCVVPPEDRRWVLKGARELLTI